MPEPESALAPTTEPAERARITGVDLARGIALLGMAATHMLTVVDPASGHLTTVGWLFAGRSSALFAVLAGVSLALVSGGTTPKTGAERSGVRVSITVRALVIGLIGLLLAETTTPVAVILAYYAVLFLLALPLLGLRARSLASLAVTWAVLSPLLSQALRQESSSGLGQQVSVTTMVLRPVTSLLELLLTGYYPVLTWLTYLLAGLAVGRLDLRSARVAVRLVVGGALLAMGSWGLSSVLTAAALAPGGALRGLGEEGATWFDLQSSESFGTTPAEAWGWLVVAAPHTGTTFDLAGTTGSALAVLGLCLLVVRRSSLRTLTRPVAAAGSMTLSLYTAHVIALSLPVGEFGSPAYYLTHVVVALVFATGWLAVFPRGPLEWPLHGLAADLGRIRVRRWSARRATLDAR